MRKITGILFSLLLFFSFCSQPERQPDEVRIRLANDPASLNPVNFSEQEALQIINLIYNSLLATDLADNTLKPGLAASMPEIERNDSLTFFTYQLRTEAEWTNGSPVTGQDVAFTLKVLKAPFVHNEHVKPQVEFIRDIILDELDPKRFTLVCEGYTPEMELLTGDFFILPAYLLDPEGILSGIALPRLAGNDTAQYNNGRIKAFASRFNRLGSPDSKDHLHGSGGYTLDHWATGKHITLKQKENWWGNTTAATDKHLTANPARISFQVIPEKATALLAIKNRQLDVLDNIPVAEFEQLRQDEEFLSDYALFSPQSYDLIFAGLNTRQAKLRDKRTRQAIAYLIDADNLIKVTEQSYAIRTVGPIPPNVKQFYHTDLKPYSFNVPQAVALLKAAGWIQDASGWYRNIDGKRTPLTIELLYRAGNTVYEQTALIFKQNAAKAGITVTIQGLEGNVFSQKIDERNFDMYLRGISGNPFVFNFKQLFHSAYAGAGGFNSTGFGTPESDRLLDDIFLAQTNEEKARLLRRLQEVLHEEAAFLPLYFRKEKMAVHRRFTNTKVSGLKPYYDVSAFLLKQ